MKFFLSGRLLAEPLPPVPLTNDDRHAVVDRTEQFVQLCGDDRAAVDRLSTVRPDVPDAAEAGEGFLGALDGVALPRLSLCALRAHS